MLTIKINDKEYTMEEARELYEELRALFEKQAPVPNVLGPYIKNPWEDWRSPMQPYVWDSISSTEVPLKANLEPDPMDFWLPQK